LNPTALAVEKEKDIPLGMPFLFLYGGQSWIRTNVHLREQIYSLPPLATRTSTLIERSMLGIKHDMSSTRISGEAGGESGF
jgi:hypothetical protein